MTVKHTLVSSDMRVFALCSLMELHRSVRNRCLTAGERGGQRRPGASERMKCKIQRHNGPIGAIAA